MTPPLPPRQPQPLNIANKSHLPGDVTFSQEPEVLQTQSEEGGEGDGQNERVMRTHEGELSLVKICDSNVVYIHTMARNSSY